MTTGSDVWSCGRGARTVVTSFNQVSWEVSRPFLSIFLFVRVRLDLLTPFLPVFESDRNSDGFPAKSEP
jgi:hypothetical protein